MKKFIAMLFLITTTWLLLPQTAFAISSQAGTSGAQFLKLGAGSRAGAMAEAYSAVADDVYAVYYNPAGLSNIQKPQIAGSHVAHFQSMSYEFAGFVYPLKSEDGTSKRALGLAIYNLGVSDIERRVGDTNAPIGTFSAGDYAYAASYAHRFNSVIGVGVNAKYIHQTLDTAKADAVAMDAGVLYSPYPDAARPVHMALVLRNVGTRVGFYKGSSDPLPLGGTLGIGYHPLPGRVKLDLDATKTRDADPFVALGAEYAHPFNADFSANLRAGYTTHHKNIDGLTGLALGAGVSFYRVSFDFAWVPFGDLGNTFRYSLLVRF